jgi:hypothetical protein
MELLLKMAAEYIKSCARAIGRALPLAFRHGSGIVAAHLTGFVLDQAARRLRSSGVGTEDE